MKVFIAGGAGYIGATTAHLFRQAGHEVVVFDNLSTGHRHNVPDFTFIEADLADTAAIAKALDGQNYDVVLDFAAKIRVDESVTMPKEYFESNTLNVVNLADATVKAGINHLIFSSTAAVYGEPESVPIDESAPIRPLNPYGMSKYLAEKVLESYQTTDGLNWVAFRYFNAAGAYKQIGPDYPFTSHLLPSIIQAFLNKQVVQVFGSDYDTPDGTCLRDYIHVVDVAAAHVLAAEKMVAGTRLNQALNLGTSKGHSVLEMIKAVEAAVDGKVDYELTDRRPGDSSQIIASGERAGQLLGWKPEHSLEQIVADAVRWQRELPETSK